MYKLTLKFLVVTALLVGAFMLLGSGRSYATTESVCNGAPYPQWGNHGGESQGEMASLTVHAYSSTGGPLDVNYTLNSDNYNGGRIFNWPIGTGRTNQKTFSTGEQLYGNGGYKCQGWSVLGDGVCYRAADPSSDWYKNLPSYEKCTNPGGFPGYWNVGDGWVLDCGSGANNLSSFWVSHVDNPGGQAGAWWLYDDNGNLLTQDLNHDAPQKMQFNVKNGGNVKIRLEWHPSSPTKTANCTYAKVTDPGLTGGGGKHTHTKVIINGTDNDGTYWVGWGDTRTINYDALSPTVTVTVQMWYVGANNPSTNNTYSYNCYHATCNPAVVGAIGYRGNGPGGIVIAGQPFTIYVPVKNDNTSGDAESIPADGVSSYYQFSMTESPDNYQGSLVEHPAGSPLDVGDTEVVQINFSANSNTGYIRTLTLNFYPDLWPHASLGDGCSVTIPIYQYFQINPSASITSTNSENPTLFNTTTPGISYAYGGSIASGSPTTTATTIGSLTKRPPNPPLTVDGAYVTSDTYGSGISYTKNYTNGGSFKAMAGDQYCSNVTISPGTGYRGPPGYGDVNDNPVSTSGCLTVTNKPYFKVRGSGAAADITVPSANGPSSSGSGLLAGWNDNQDTYGDTTAVDRGAGAELSALALIKITGFASAQTNITNSPTALTFANTNGSDISSHYDSPSLGGNFGGQERNITVPKPTSTSNVLSGNQTIGNITVNGNVSYFVNGNVYINGPITYNTGGWSPGNVPSFVLVATGNIYIDKSVTELDGLYLAQPKDATTGGNIYTCASAQGTPDSNYTDCNNQLVVYGSFVANQVRMLRTFGSLRDEIPNPATGSTTATSNGLVWSCGGGSCNPSLSGLNCIHTNEPADPDTWQDNQLCWPPTNSDGSANTLKLAWTHYSNSPYADPSKDPGKSDPGMLSLNYWKSNGYPYCVQWDVPEDYAQTWNDNYLCSNQNKNFSFVKTPDTASNRECVKITEPSDPQGQWASGYYLCGDITPATSGSPPTSQTTPACSNKGSQSITNTCAGEIFWLGPEFYLSNPNVQPPSGGATQYDSINSLPPVL